jgi:hypothetical protein
MNPQNITHEIRRATVDSIIDDPGAPQYNCLQIIQSRNTG